MPQSGPGPVEVLAVAALSPIEGSAPSIDDCVGYYRDFLDGKTDACAPSEPCAACIFARRSLGFVEYSNLDLTISLDNECAGVLCEASKTCVPERGCVSAVVECNGSDCEEPGGVGGAASGAGGSGGSGGENTGGAPPTVGWQLLPVTGGVPHDIVAQSTSFDGSLELDIHVAAGDRMLRFRDRALFFEVPGSLADDYLAVAAEPGGTRVVAVGAEGPSLGPNFAPSGVAPAGFVDLDIAIRNGAQQPTITIDRGPNQSCDYGPGTDQWSQCGAAVFAVGVGSDAQELFAGGPAFGVGMGAEYFVAFGPAGTDSPDWSLWGHPLSFGQSGEVAHAYALANESLVRRFWASSQGTLILQDISLSGVSVGVTIDAIWGVERVGGVDLFAVGAIAGSGWLGKAEVFDSADTFDGWETLPIPAGIQTLRSVWVGPDPRLGDALVVIVAGTTQSNEGIVAITELGSL